MTYTAAARISEPPAYLYLSRRKSRRPVANEDDVMASLESLGFSAYLPEDYSFGDQARLFSQARVIVAPSGAALGNLIFAPAEARVIDLFGSMETHSYYSYTCALNQAYSFLLCDHDGQSMTIDVEKLKRIIERAMT
jgi:capsular polysaccharide biosynthesis protein